MANVNCFACGAVVADSDGPVHRYMESAPGCWAAYGEVLAREYGDARYARNHRLTVDAYAAQHPGRPSAQSIQSVGRHLISLQLVLERNVAQPHVTRLLAGVEEAVPTLCWLDPPTDAAAMTVNDVLAAAEPAEHAEAVAAWAESVWQSWQAQHATVRHWAELVLPDPAAGSR